MNTAHSYTKLYSGDSIGDWSDTTVGGETLWKADWTPSEINGDFNSPEDRQYTPAVIGGDSLYRPRLTVGAVTQAGYFYYNYTDDRIYIWPYLGGDPDTSCPPH
jgi:hypothetical protein